jgi:hypothetical protein
MDTERKEKVAADKPEVEIDGTVEIRNSVDGTDYLLAAAVLMATGKFTTVAAVETVLELRWRFQQEGVYL